MDLTAFQHSAFLQSLGWAIANSLWQAAILWGLFHIINASYKHAGSKFKNNSATVFLFSTFAWFLYTFVGKFMELSGEGTPTIVIPEDQLSQFSAYINQPENLINWQQLMNDASAALPYLSIAYLLLLVLFTTKWLSAYRQTSFIRKNGLQKAAVEWRLFTEKAAMHIGIHKKISIWFSKHVDVPATIGFLKPIILIPIASLNQLTVQQLEAIILHELAHIRRNDYLVNLFMSVIEIVMFYNPFVVLLAKVMKRERENCCDDFVIQYQYDRLSYASALLSIEQYRLQQHKLAMAAVSNKKQLFSRVKRIMENEEGKKGFNYGQKLIALLIITGVISSIAWFSPADQENPVAKQQRDTPPIALASSSAGRNVPHLHRNYQMAEVWKALKKDYSSKEIKDAMKIAKVVNTAQNKIVASIPEILAIEPELSKLKIQNAKPLKLKDFAPLMKIKNAFTGDQAFAFNFTNAYTAEDLFKTLPSAIDIKGLQLDLQKIKKELSAIEWDKMESELKQCVEGVQKDIQQLPAEFRRSAPVFRQLMQDELVKVQGQLEKLRTFKRVQRDVDESRVRTVQGNKMFMTTFDSISLVALAKTKVNGHYYIEPVEAPIVYDRMIAIPGTGGAAAKTFYSTTTPPTSWSYNDDGDVYFADEDKDTDNKEEKDLPCKSKTTIKAPKMNVEFKNGILYIDGEKINIQELKDQDIKKFKNKHIKVITRNNEQIEIRIGT